MMRVTLYRIIRSMHHVFFSALYKQREKEGYYTEVELVEIEKNNEKGVL